VPSINTCGDDVLLGLVKTAPLTYSTCFVDVYEDRVYPLTRSEAADFRVSEINRRSLEMVNMIDFLVTLLWKHNEMRICLRVKFGLNAEASYRLVAFMSYFSKSMIFPAYFSSSPDFFVCLGGGFARSESYFSEQFSNSAHSTALCDEFSRWLQVRASANWIVSLHEMKVFGSLFGSCFIKKDESTGGNVIEVRPFNSGRTFYTTY